MLGFLKWDEREPYEKTIMIALAGLILLALFWFIAVQPILSAKSAAQARSNKVVRDYEIVSRAVPVLGRDVATASGEGFSRTMLIDMARQKSVKLSRVQPEGDTLLVWMDDINTVKLYDFLEELMVEGGAELTRATISSNDSGLLSAQFTLR